MSHLSWSCRLGAWVNPPDLSLELALPGLRLHTPRQASWPSNHHSLTAFQAFPCGHEGRRIEAVDGGWKVLNGEYYKQKMGPEQRREYQAAWMREYRKRKKENKREGACAGAREAIDEGLKASGLDTTNLK